MRDMDNNRLLLQLEQLMREINRKAINSEVELLNLDGLRPLVELVARSRAAYLKRLFSMAGAYSESGGLPTNEEMNEVRRLRQNYMDLSDASKSVEIAIQRGYLDLDVV